MPEGWFNKGSGSAPERRWGFFGERIAVKGGLCLRRVFGEAVQEEVVGLFALAAGGFKPAAQDAVVLQTLAGTRAVDDFAQDDDRAQTALGLIVGRGDVGAAETGEEVLLLRAHEAFAERLGFGMA